MTNTNFDAVIESQSLKCFVSYRFVANNFSFIDPDRIAVTGVSYGGYVAGKKPNLITPRKGRHSPKASKFLLDLYRNEREDSFITYIVAFWGRSDIEGYKKGKIL